MSTELDVSWFDLKKYDDLASMDLSGWHTQLDVRNLIFFNYVPEGKGEDEYTDLRKDVRVYEFFERIKENPIWRHDNNNQDIDKMQLKTTEKYPFNTYSVSNTTAGEICFLVEDDRFENIRNDFERWNFQADDLSEKINTPIDVIFPSGRFVNLTIDLSATNEQLNNDFTHWLVEYRKYTGYHSNKNNFTNKDLANWHDLGVIPCIDLTIHAAIEGKKITDSALSELINQSVDRLRKTIKPKARQLLRYETLDAIEAQLG
ncbi:MAG: DUF6387 family protein [Methylococcales bacterium]|nr:DUF6387 family protein [Methylococcales bacterium]